jgi:hypothetical protein
MAIEIIDGFKVSSAIPVDDRIVASGSTARDAITYKYEGLRVFDTSDSIPYVWINSTWEKENKTALAVPSTVTPGFTNTPTYRAGQILKVYNSNKLLTNSNMFEVEWDDTLGNITFKTVAINHSNPASVSSTARLDVNGTIKSTTFEGSGANILNLNFANFNSNSKLNINQIAVGASGFILQTVDDGFGNLSTEWKNPSSVISPNSVSTDIESVSPTIHYLTFVPNTNGGSLHVYKNSPTQAIGVIPSSGQVVVKSDNSPTSPPYSFLGEQNTGIYRSAAGSVAVSILGNKRIEIDTNGLKVNAGNAANPGISFIGANNYGIYQTTTGNNRIGVVVAGNEMMRIRSSSTQGNGNTTFYGDGAVLSVQGNTHAFIEFYRQGSNNPNTPSTRGAWIGYSSGSSQDFNIMNNITNTNLTLQNDGRTFITSRVNGTYGVQIGNSGPVTVTNGYGVSLYGTFNNIYLTTNHSAIIAKFDATNGSNTTYTSTYVTTQGLLIWGCPTGTGIQPLYSGSAARPSIAFNNNTTSGFYSDAANTIGITTNGTKKMVINSTGVQMSAFESQALAVPTVSAISNASSSNNAFNGVNSACINAVAKTLLSNSNTYTARWIRLGFKFNNYTGSSISSQVVVFAADTCDRMFYCGVGGNTPTNFRGFEAIFYIGGLSNGNYLGRFLSNTGANEQIYNGAGSFYVPANHVFTIVFEWYSNGSAVNDTSTEGGFAMDVRSFRMGLS